MKEKIIAAYLAHITAQGTRPKSVFDFAQNLEITEKDFYASFGSFASLEAEIMRQFFAETTQRLSQSPEYAGYGARERALAVVYTLLEVLRENRSAIVVMERHNDSLMGAAKAPFCAWVRTIVHLGMDTKEVAERLFVSDWYQDMLWWQMWGILHFWIRDESADFEQTDAFVEKSVNFSFDLFQPNFVDSGFDFLKWMVQSK